MILSQEYPKFSDYLVVCHGIFFVSSWCVAAVAYRLGDHLWNDDKFFMILICFFLFQMLGSFLWGIVSDAYGRLFALQWLCWKLWITIVFLICFAFLLSEVNEPQEASLSSFSNLPFLTNGTYRPSLENITIMDESLSSPKLHSYLSFPIDSLFSVNRFSLFPNTLWTYYYPKVSYRLLLYVILVVGGVTLGAIYTVTPLVLVHVGLPSVRLISLCCLFAMKTVAQLTLRCLVACLLTMVPTLSIDHIFRILLGISFCFSCLLIVFSVALRRRNGNALKCPTTWGVASNMYFDSMWRGASATVHSQTGFHHEFLSKPPDVFVPLTFSHPSMEFLLKEHHHESPNVERIVFESFSFSWTTYFHNILVYLHYFPHYLLGCCLPSLILSLSFHNDGFVDPFFMYLGLGIQNESFNNLFKLSLACITWIGTLLSIWCIMHSIPKLLQMLGFAVMGFVNFGLALSLFSIKHPVKTSMMVHPVKNLSTYFAASLLYQCVFSSGTLLPLLTCFLIPLNCCPLQIRGIFYASVVAASKLGVVVGLWLSSDLAILGMGRASILALYSLTGLLGGMIFFLWLMITRAFTPDVRSF